MKNKKIISIGVLLSLFMMMRACGQMTTLVSVKDEQGNPIEGAEVEFLYARPQGYESVKKTTNHNGVVKDTGKTNFHLNVYVEKKGFYQATYAKSNKGTNLEKNKNHDLTVTLKKEVNPIGLFAKKWRLLSPSLGEKIGYDFEVGDWVRPHGVGNTADIFFEVHFDIRDRSDYDYSLNVTFPNSLDGLQDFEGLETSALRSDHKAPNEGYLATWKQTTQRRPGETKKGNRDPSRNYWLRVRSKADEEGNLISAHYVKIYGDFPDIQYYFNPTPNDRNLEFDPQKNLFKNLPYDQKVNQP